MCGLVGFMATKPIKGTSAERLAHYLLAASDVRGNQAAGAVFRDNKGALTLTKAPCAGAKLKMTAPDAVTAFLGHTRLATGGDVKKNKNNHPWIVGDYAYAHNGVLWNDAELANKHELPYTNVETDSYIVPRLLTKFGGLNMSNLKKVCEAVEGNFVFEFLRKEGVMFAMSDNPLYISQLKLKNGGSIIIWASTKEIHDKALGEFSPKMLKAATPFTTIKDGDILFIDNELSIFKTEFEPNVSYAYYTRYMTPYYSRHSVCGEYDDDYDWGLAIDWLGILGIEEETILALRDSGYTIPDIFSEYADALRLEQSSIKGDAFYD